MENLNFQDLKFFVRQNTNSGHLEDWSCHHFLISSIFIPVQVLLFYSLISKY
ncbi:hypothetical protein BRARA_F01845 [Brassica rapa]|uniref:Uncharacterized protein n=1 Tax=Brassica campestris TaxID=3711 RepID=A0A397Z8M5_BRACM|nr:hypothetical protein BRARA_F01845 [Brassica rapa]